MEIRCMEGWMGLVSFVVGNQELTWESLELHALTPPLPSFLGRNNPSKAKLQAPLIRTDQTKHKELESELHEFRDQRGKHLRRAGAYKTRWVRHAKQLFFQTSALMG